MKDRTNALATLRYLTPRERVAICIDKISDSCLEDIQLWGSSTNKCPVTVGGPWMIFSRARTSREPLAGKVRKSTIVILVVPGESRYGLSMIRLVGQCSPIARIITIWPHSFERGTVTSSSKVAYRRTMSCTPESKQVVTDPSSTQRATALHNEDCRGARH